MDNVQCVRIVLELIIAYELLGGEAAPRARLGVIYTCIQNTYMTKLLPTSRSMKLLPRSKVMDGDDLGRCNLGHTRLKVMT